MGEGDSEELRRDPDFSWVLVHARRYFGSVGVVVEAAAHLEQLCDGDLVAIGHARDVLRDRIVEGELVLLSQLRDERGGHRLGVGGDAEVRGGARRYGCAELRGAVGDGEFALGGTQENDGAGEKEFFRGLVEHGLQCGLVDPLEP